jgi:hypothetical protein
MRPREIAALPLAGGSREDAVQYQAAAPRVVRALLDRLPAAARRTAQPDVADAAALRALHDAAGAPCARAGGCGEAFGGRARWRRARRVRAPRSVVHPSLRGRERAAHSVRRS